MTHRRAILKGLTVGLTAAGLPALLPESAHARSAAGSSEPGSLRPSDLRVEWRAAPLGIDTLRPRFSWTLEPADPLAGPLANKGARHLQQTAWRVIVAPAEAAARAGRGDIWDSGRQSGQTLHAAPAADLPLAAQTPYHWSVQVWDQRNQPSLWSDPQSFITGIPDSRGWHALWIAATPERPHAVLPAPAINSDPPVSPEPLPLMRRGFHLERLPARAIVCVSGLGHYELRLNGRRCGAGVLDPGWTNYRKTVLYDTFDVTPLLCRGENTLAVLLGNGMYNVEKYAGRYTKWVGSYGQPKLILQLKLTFTDGSQDLIVSDSAWETCPGPIVLSHVYGGEDFDARLEPVGWDQPQTRGAPGWSRALEVEPPGGVLRAQNVPSVVVAQQLAPVAVHEPQPGVLVYDLGECFSGWPAIRVQGPPGRTIRLLPGELLDDKGRVSQRSANARPGNEVCFSYVLKGEGEETWHPRFTYQGLRYVQVEGAGGDVELRSLSGEFLHTQLPEAGSFVCSHPLLNRIHALIRQALLSNTMSVLTDCPQREKLGWLEQAYLNADTVFYNEEAVTLYEKMLGDMKDSQLADGLVPGIAPEYVAFLNSDGSNAIYRDSPEWGAAIVLAPWSAYRFTGSLRMLEAGYGAMQRYVRCLTSRLNGGLLDFGMGDWYDVGPRPPGESQWTGKSLTATATYCEVLKTLGRIAQLLGRRADAARYELDAQAGVQAFNARLFDPATSRYDRGSMTALAMPLALGLVPPEHRAQVLEHLIADIRAHGNHVTSGDIGFHYVVRALLEAERGDVLLDLLTQTDAPSYGYQLAQGATALTESWDANPSKSQNHFMLGHAETWLYRGLAGISIDFDRPAASRIRIAPQMVQGVEWASARHRCVLGEIASSWRRAGGRMHLDVVIPAGAMAQIEIPDARADQVTESGTPLRQARGVLQAREPRQQELQRVVLTVGSGSYRFESPSPVMDP